MSKSDIAKDITKIVVEATPKPLWIVLGDILFGILLAVAFLRMTDAIITTTEAPYLKLAGTVVYGLPAWLGCMLVLLAGLGIALLLTLVAIKAFDERYDDALTPLRKSLVGPWSLTATTSDGAPAWHGNANFVIDELKKLRIELTIPQSEAYEELPVNVVDISLNPRTEPVTITYFCSMRFVKRHRANERDEGTEIREFFVRMERKQIKNVEKLNGSWHELTNPAAGSISFERLVG